MFGQRFPNNKDINKLASHDDHVIVKLDALDLKTETIKVMSKT